jgi:hypothetical protein
MQLNGPVSLKEIGMKHDDLDRAASLVTQSPYYNPRPPDRESIRRLLDDAFIGRRPQFSRRAMFAYAVAYYALIELAKSMSPPIREVTICAS